MAGIGDRIVKAKSGKKKRQEKSKPKPPPLRTFKVRRSPDDPQEGIEAHRYDFTAAGDLLFYVFTDAELLEDGAMSFGYKTVKGLATGTWYEFEDVTDEFKSQSSVN